MPDRRTAQEALQRLTVDVADWPEKGVTFKDITPVLADHHAFSAIITALAAAGRDDHGTVVVDKVVGMEARGSILAAPVALALGIGFVAYAPLGRGFLTGTIQDFAQVDGRRAAHPRFQEANFAANRALVVQVEAMAAERGCTPAQLTLAWLLAQGEDVVPIPGTKRRAYLDQNIGALEVEITIADREEIDRLLPPGAAAGARYPAASIATVGR